MATIIAGRFEQQAESGETIDALLRAGFARERIASFYLNPHGQHATYPLGGDEDRSPGAKGTGKGVAAGAAAGAAVGAAATAFLGPIGAITGGLLGAHVGGLVGGLSQMKERGDIGKHAEDVENAAPVRHAGMYVAIAVNEDEDEGLAARTLASSGAIDLERADGTIRDGDWVDFDPTSSPIPLPSAAPQRVGHGPTQRP